MVTTEEKEKQRKKKVMKITEVFKYACACSSITRTHNLVVVTCETVLWALSCKANSDKITYVWIIMIHEQP